MKFGDKVRRLRKEKKLTQAELAEKLGVHLNTVNRWETLAEPIDDITKLVNLSHELGTTVPYLRGENEKADGEPININAGEYVEIKPIIEKLGDGHVFYYEYQDQKVEIPASKEFFDLFLKAIKEVQVSRQRVNQQVVTA